MLLTLGGGGGGVMYKEVCKAHIMPGGSGGMSPGKI